MRVTYGMYAKCRKNKCRKETCRKKKVEMKNVENEKCRTEKCRINRKSCLMLIMKYLFDFNEKKEKYVSYK